MKIRVYESPSAWKVYPPQCAEAERLAEKFERFDDGGWIVGYDKRIRHHVIVRYVKSRWFEDGRIHRAMVPEIQAVLRHPENENRPFFDAHYWRRFIWERDWTKHELSPEKWLSQEDYEFNRKKELNDEDMWSYAKKESEHIFKHKSVVGVNGFKQ